MTSVHLGYIISCLANNPDKRMVTHTPIFVDSRTHDEATGYGLRIAKELLPASAGYTDHQVVVKSMSIADWHIKELYAQLDAAA